MGVATGMTVTWFPRPTSVKAIVLSSKNCRGTWAWQVAFPLRLSMASVQIKIRSHMARDLVVADACATQPLGVLRSQARTLVPAGMTATWFLKLWSVMAQLWSVLAIAHNTKSCQGIWA